MDIARILKANPYHDKVGRFTHAAGFSSKSAWADFGSPAKMKAILRDENSRVELYVKEITEIEKPPRNVGFGTTISPFGEYTTDPHEYRRVNIARAAQDWSDVFGASVTPKQFVQSLAGDSSELNMSMVLSLSNLKVVVKDSVIHGAKVENMGRIFDFPTRTVNHNLLELDPRSQGSGAIAKQFREAIPMYKALGMDTVALRANLDVGGYAWARYGFKAKHVEEIEPLHRKSLAKLKTEPPSKKRDATIKLLERILSTRDVDALLDSPRLIAASSVGKQVMLGAHWTGYLDLKDPKRLAIFERYVREKSNKKPKK